MVGDCSVRLGSVEWPHDENSSCDRSGARSLSGVFRRRADSGADVSGAADSGAVAACDGTGRVRCGDFLVLRQVGAVIERTADLMQCGESEAAAIEARKAFRPAAAIRPCPSR